MANVDQHHQRLLPALVSRPNVRSMNGLANYLDAQRSQAKDNVSLGALMQNALRSMPGNALLPMDASAHQENEALTKSPATQPDDAIRRSEVAPISVPGKSARLLRDEEVISSDSTSHNGHVRQ